MKRLALLAVLFATPASAQSYPGRCERGHWVQSTADNGGVVVLEDGSVWVIALIDKIMTMLWLPTDTVLACPDRLIKTDNGETVGARRVR